MTRIALGVALALAACNAPEPPRAATAAPVCPSVAASKPGAPAADAILDKDIALPPRDVRLAMFDAVARSIDALDGDGKIFRDKRAEPWPVTVAKVRAEAEAATSLVELGRAFKRLDATYPNLHTPTAAVLRTAPDPPSRLAARGDLPRPIWSRGGDDLPGSRGGWVTATRMSRNSEWSSLAWSS